MQSGMSGVGRIGFHLQDGYAVIILPCCSKPLPADRLYMFYENVFLALERHRVRYAVAGGVAVNLHGIPRMTADLDLVVDLESENLRRFLQSMQELGYHPRLPVPAEELLDQDKRKDWIENRNLHAFTFWNEKKPFEEVDVLLQVPQIPNIIERAVRLQIESMTLFLVQLDDLMEMKRAAGREQDHADLDALEKLKTIEKE